MPKSSHPQSSSSAKALPANDREALAAVKSLPRRTATLSLGCPSFGGQRTLGCYSITTVGAPRSFALRCAVERFRVGDFGLYASAPRPHRPNPSFELTRSGRPALAFISFWAKASLPPRAAQLKR